MNRWALIFPSIAFASLLASGPSCMADESPIYTRADVEVAVTGEASLRRAYTQRLELPWPDCSGKAFSCYQDGIYGQVYQIEFVEETVLRDPDGTTHFDRTDRGRLSIAVGFDLDAEAAFEEALAGTLQTLVAVSYSRPWAGHRFNREPLEIRKLRQSGLPAWVCHELDGVRGFDLVFKTDKGESTYARGGETADAACRAVGAAVENSLPDVYRSAPQIRRQVRHEAHLIEASSLRDLTWADRLVQIPAAATLEKHPLEKNRKTGGIRDKRDGFFIGHEGRYGKAERSVRLPAAALDVAGAPMWAARWTFETVHETFGESPRVERDPSVSMIVAVLPIDDPLMTVAKRQESRLHFPRERLIEQTQDVFKSAATLGPENVVLALARPELWPSKGDWMIVTCTEEGSARYGIAPFASVAVVTNPAEVCAAIEREFDANASRR